MKFDLFISHASEDKDSLVRPLAHELAARNLTIWYDEFSLKPGDSLRESIDRGLSESRYAVLVISPSFFVKPWPKWELNRVVQSYLTDERPALIPIWHNIESREVLQHSPSLADIVAIKSSIGINAIAEKIVSIIAEETSQSPSRGMLELSSGDQATITSILSIMRSFAAAQSGLRSESVRCALFTHMADELAVARPEPTTIKEVSAIGLRDLVVRSEVAVPVFDEQGVIGVLGMEFGESQQGEFLFEFGQFCSDIISVVLRTRS